MNAHPFHAADAGGDPATLEAKQELREQVWQRFERERVSRFPGARGRIPNFAGAAQAAERLRELEQWGQWQVMKANPDAAQWPVRERALADGLRLFVAVPRLAEPDPFLALDPGAVDESPRVATSIKGAARHGRPVAVDALPRVDVVVVGCVAVDPTGARLGKGGGFADLEFALAQETGMIDDATVVVTTVHPLQVLDPGAIPVTEHDVTLDAIATPEGVQWCHGARSRPAGVQWAELTEEKIAAIPLLGRLRGADR